MQEKKVIVINPTITSFDNGVSKETPKKRVSAYARVSTDQEDQINSYNAQIKEYTERIKTNPNWEFVEMYADEGISGTGIKNRVAFMKMITDAKAGKIDLILTKSLSRFSRNTVDSLTVIRELREIGVEVFFEKENLSSLDTKIDFMLTIFSSIAQEESRNTSENVKWGIRKRFQEGKVKVNVKRFLGYDKNSEGNLVINEEEAKTVRMIFNMYVAGNSYKDICEILINENLPNGRGEVKWVPSSIKNILENEKYAGDLILQKRVVLDYLTHKSVHNDNIVPKYHVMNNHEPIVSRELFKLAQVRKTSQAKLKSSTYTDKFPLSGIVYCATCGRVKNRNYYGYGRPSERVVLTCKNNYHSQMKCSNKPIDNQTLENAAANTILELNLYDETIIHETLDVVITSFDQSEILNEIEFLTDKIRQTEDEIVSLIETKIKDKDESKTKYYNDIYTIKKETIAQDELKIKDLENDLISKHNFARRVDALKEFLSNDVAMSSIIISTVFKRIIVLKPDEVIFVLSNTVFENDNTDFDINLIKELTPIYESEHDDKTTGFKINYKVVNYVGDENERN